MNVGLDLFALGLLTIPGASSDWWRLDMNQPCTCGRVSLRRRVRHREQGKTIALKPISWRGEA